MCIPNCMKKRIMSVLLAVSMMTSMLCMPSLGAYTDNEDGVIPQFLGGEELAGNSDEVVYDTSQASETPFSMYVPTSIFFRVDKDGTVTYTPTDPKIYSGVDAKDICVTDISVTAQTGWQLVDYNADFSQYGKDSAYVGLSINGVPVDAGGDVAITPEDWVVAAGSTLDLDFDLKVPEQTAARELTEVLKVNFTGDWYFGGGEAENITIAFGQGYNGTISGVDSIQVPAGKTLGELKDQFPDTEPFMSVFSGWMRNGELLTDDSVIEESCTLVAKFDSYFTHNSGVVTGISDFYWNDEDRPGDMIIPESIDGTTITSIGQSAFEVPNYNAWTEITSFALPETLTRIESRAFVSTDFCRTPKTVMNLPSGLTYIGDHAFWDARFPGGITIPSGITTISDSAFSSCVIPGEIIIPSSVKTIGEYGFAYCSETTSIQLPSGLKTIGNRGFAGCGMTTIDVPDSVTSLGDEAFIACKQLETVTLGTGITRLAGAQFQNCTELKTIYLNGRITEITTSTMPAFWNCSNIQDVYINRSQSAFNAAGKFGTSSPTIHYVGYN